MTMVQFLSKDSDDGMENSNSSSSSNHPSILFRRRPTNNKQNGSSIELSKHGLSSPLNPTSHGGHTEKHSHDSSKASAFQGQSYEPDESEVWRAHVAYNHYSHRGKWLSPVRRREVKRWMLAFLIGVVQSVLLLACNLLIRSLTRKKFNVVSAMMHPNEDVRWEDNEDDLMVVKVDDRTDDSVIGDHSYDNKFYAFVGYPFFSYLFFQLLYTFISTAFVFIEPAAGGSGITEIKCLLNGINMPGLVEFKTLVCKVLGVCFSVASGLPIGKEGPMFHSGAIVAGVLSQGQFSFRGIRTSIAELSDFRNPWEKRDFIACGAAAGIASAFSAPIGGVLLSLEEGSSFWSTKLTWRAFFCAMISLFTLQLIKSSSSGLGKEDIEKLFNFGEFNKSKKGESSFAIWEILIFMLMGCIGGCLGALFNQASEYLSKWRIRKVNYSKYLRALEALCVSIVVSFAFYFVPYFWKICTPLPTDTKGWSEQEKHLLQALVPFQCQAGKEYNQVASLIFTDADNTIKQLLHSRNGFSAAALFLFFITYFIMATVAFGIAVPAGLFIPALLSGAGFGRFCGRVLHNISPTTFADEGIYALIGSAAMLGGKARMTISLTIILLEASGDMEFVLPLMFTLMCARFTGNIFNEGIYELGIHLKHIPFLEPEIPKVVDKQELLVDHVMSSEVKVVRLVERAGVVYDMLKTYSHSTFPIVDMTSSRILYGTVSRDVLCTLLLRKAFGDFDDPGIAIGPKRLSPLVQWPTIQRAYPKYPTIDDVDFSPADRNRLLDLRPYANTAPYTIHSTASIQRTYTLFRTLGLRFLCVVNNSNQIVGMVTRKDLLAGSLEESLQKIHVEEKNMDQHVVS